MNQNYKETIVLAVPVIIGQLSQLLMNVSDNLIVGRLENGAFLSAASLANSCFIFIAIFAFGALNAVPSVVSEARGAENNAAIAENLKASLWVGLFWGIIIGALVYFFSLLMPYMGQPESDVLQAQPFMWLLALATPFMCLFMAMKGFFDGMEKTDVGMNVSIIGLFLNILLNIALVFGYFGCPKFGLIGSAWATLISTVLRFLIMLYIFKTHQLTSSIFSFEKPNFSYFKTLVSLGFPMGMQLFFEVGAFAGAGIMIGWLPGDEATIGRSAHQIVLNMVSLTFMVMLGISVAGSIRVGEAFGRKDGAAIREAGRTALVLCWAFSLTSAAALIIFKSYFTSLYGIENVDVQAVTIRLAVIAAVFQIFDGSQCVGAGLLRGVQDVTIPTIITFVAYWVIWLPLAYWMGFTHKMGVDGIWYADVIALGLAGILLNWRFFALAPRKLES
jgi:multidrug resistance protein, MATE family